MKVAFKGYASREKLLDDGTFAHGGIVDVLAELVVRLLEHLQNICDSESRLGRVVIRVLNVYNAAVLLTALRQSEVVLAIEALRLAVEVDAVELEELNQVLRHLPLLLLGAVLVKERAGHQHHRVRIETP